MVMVNLKPQYLCYSEMPQVVVLESLDFKSAEDYLLQFTLLAPFKTYQAAFKWRPLPPPIY